MKFSDIANTLWKRGYVDYETKESHRVFYECDKMDFLYNDCAKRFEMDYKNGEVEKIVMTQYWFQTTYFKDIFTIEELIKSL
jgi:hypothetical protein